MSLYDFLVLQERIWKEFVALLEEQLRKKVDREICDAMKPIGCVVSCKTCAGQKIPGFIIRTIETGESGWRRFAKLCTPCPDCNWWGHVDAATNQGSAG